MAELEAQLQEIIESAGLNLYSYQVEELRKVLARKLPKLAPLIDSRLRSGPLITSSALTTRRRHSVKPPPEAYFLVGNLSSGQRGLLNALGQKPFSRMTCFPTAELAVWYEFSPLARDAFIRNLNDEAGLPGQALVLCLFASGLMRLAEGGWVALEADRFCQAWGPGMGGLAFLLDPAIELIARTVIAITKSQDWLPRIRRYEYHRCRRWFVDRSPTWRGNPAKYCSDSHRSGSAKSKKLSR